MNLAQIEQELQIKFKRMSKKDFEKFVERMCTAYNKVHIRENRIILKGMVKDDGN